MVERIPPFDLEAEEAVLGAMLTSHVACRSVSLSPQDFYSDDHRLIYEAVKETGADPILVADCLRRRGLLERVGGTSYILALVASSHLAAYVGRYVAIVKECALLRKLIDVASTVSLGAYDRKDAHELAEEASAQFASVLQGLQQDAPK